MLLALIWQFDFPPFMVLIIAILNDGLYFSFDLLISLFYLALLTHLSTFYSFYSGFVKSIITSLWCSTNIHFVFLYVYPKLKCPFLFPHIVLLRSIFLWPKELWSGKICITIYKIYIVPGTIMTISKDRVKASPQPDSWKLAEIFTTGIILGSYLAMMTVIFFWAAYKTDFFPVRQTIDIFLCFGGGLVCCNQSQKDY